ncbi:MAG: ribokinase [Planctomycetota bacterium]
MKTPNIVMVGSSMVDLIAYVPKLPAPGETLAGSDFNVGCGGKGANQAVMAARLGAQVHVVTVLGDDVFGPQTKQNFADQGCDTTHVHIAKGIASGVAPISVDTTTGQNSIVIVPGANELLDEAKVRAAGDEIAAADAVICQLETPIAATVEAFKLARAAGTTTILNPAPAAPIGDDLLALVDIFIPNETEAAELTGMPVDTNDQAVAAARALQQRGPVTVILTLGSRGALVLEGDAEPAFVEAKKVEAVDTTGAGDAFVGSFSYYHAAGHSAPEAARHACHVATLSVLGHGTQTSFPTRDDVDAAR